MQHPRNACAVVRRVVLLVGLAFVLTHATSTTASAVTINFDNLTAAPSSSAGSPVPTASQLSNQYASQGVLFTSLGGYASVVNLGAGTPSSPNGIGGSGSDGTISYSVPIEITFVSPLDSLIPAVTDFVSIRGDLFVTALGTNTMIALDISGNPIDFDIQIEPPESILSVSGTGIHKVILIGSGSTAFDDLTFTSVVPVPEPSTLVLAAFGVAGIAALGWRKRKARRSA